MSISGSWQSARRTGARSKEVVSIERPSQGVQRAVVKFEGSVINSLLTTLLVFIRSFLDYQSEAAIQNTVDHGYRSPHPIV
jgi:hypothetical protein